MIVPFWSWNLSDTTHVRSHTKFQLIWAINTAFTRGGHNVPPPLTQMCSWDPLTIRVKYHQPFAMSTGQNTTSQRFLPLSSQPTTPLFFLYNKIMITSPFYLTDIFFKCTLIINYKDLGRAVAGVRGGGGKGDAVPSPVLS